MKKVQNLGVIHRIGLALVLGLCGLLILTGLATAKWNVFRAANLVLKFDGGVTPRALPRHELAPAGVTGKFQITSTDGSHIPALRGGTFEGDRNIAFDTAGLPVCRKGELEARNSDEARNLCGDAVVGTGNATVEISFPESAPITVKSPLTFFNAGSQGGITTFLVHIFITVPIPAAIVSTVKLKRVSDGRYGLRIITEIPKVAGGAGSVTDASFDLKRLFTYKGKKRSYLLAKCPDGRFQFKVVNTDFEVAGLPAGASPAFSGTLSRPCTPKG
jgi:hypothetical protein